MNEVDAKSDGQNEYNDFRKTRMDYTEYKAYYEQAWNPIAWFSSASPFCGGRRILFEKTDKKPIIIGRVKMMQDPNDPSVRPTYYSTMNLSVYRAFTLEGRASFDAADEGIAGFDTYLRTAYRLGRDRRKEKREIIVLAIDETSEPQDKPEERGILSSIAIDGKLVNPISRGELTRRLLGREFIIRASVGVKGFVHKSESYINLFVESMEVRYLDGPR